MRIDRVNYRDRWLDAKFSARNTVSKDGSGMYPTESWKKTILLAEHSPIRKILFGWRWSGLKYWISVHMVRHKFGIEHWVSTQRSDRTGVNRDNSPQGSLVNHECEANAQALIFISRRRLCMQAHPQTRQAWQKVVDQVEVVDPVLASVMVPECIYRGFCPQFKSCGYCNTEEYQKRLAEYRNKRLE